MKFIFVFMILFSISSHARVFSVTQSNFATYFKGSYGLSAVDKNAYNKTSGLQTSFSDSATANWGGELGFIFPSQYFAFKVGLELISPNIPGGIQGKDSGGTPLMSLDSTVNGFFPVGHFEYYVGKDANGRAYISLGAGYGKVTVSNDYTMTTAGTLAYPGSSSFKEKASQYAYLLETAVGYEMSFVQTSTVSFDLGYRYSIADNLKYDSAGTNFIGAHAAGATVVNSDGKHKTLDLGGVFAGLSFRFYFN
jgi:hypothetical protein